MVRTICLQNAQTTCHFVEAAMQFPETIEVSNGRARANAKSLLDIFRFDLRQPLELTIHAGVGRAREIYQALIPFLTTDQTENHKEAET